MSSPNLNNFGDLNNTCSETSNVGTSKSTLPITGPMVSKHQDKAARIIQSWLYHLRQKTTANEVKALLDSAISVKASQGKSFEYFVGNLLQDSPSERKGKLNDEEVINSTRMLMEIIDYKTSKFLPNLTPLPERKKPLETFLFSFPLAVCPEEVQTQGDERHNQFNLEQSQAAKIMLESYDKLCDCLLEESSEPLGHRDRLKTMLKTFNDDKRAYLASFSKWVKADDLQTIDFYIKSCLELEESILKSQNDPSGQGQEIYLISIEEQKKLKRKITALGGEESTGKLQEALDQLHTWWEKDKFIFLSELQQAHEMIMNTESFTFSHTANGFYTQKIVNLTRQSVQKSMDDSAPDTSYMVHLLQEIRQKIVEVCPSRAESITEKLNDGLLEQYSMNLANPEAFVDFFQVIIAMLFEFQAPARDGDTSQSIGVFVELIQNGQSPLALLPETLGTIYDTLMQIKVDKKNFYLNLNRNEARKLAIETEKEGFKSMMKNYETTLNKTYFWIKNTLEDPSRHNLTTPMLYSSFAPDHVHIAGILNLLKKTELTPDADFVETMFMDRERLRDFQNQVQVYTQVGTSLALFKEALSKAACPITEKALSDLSDMILMRSSLHPHEAGELAELVTAYISVNLRKNGRGPSLEAHGLTSGWIRTNVASTSTVSQLLNKKIIGSLHQFLYKGYISDSSLPSGLSAFLTQPLQKMGRKLSNLISGNLEVHRELYAEFISTILFNKLFPIMSSQETPTVEKLSPLCLEGEIDTIRKLHKDIRLLAHMVNSLTILRQKVWISNELMFTTTIPDSEMESLINTGHLTRTFPKSPRTCELDNRSEMDRSLEYLDLATDQNIQALRTNGPDNLHDFLKTPDLNPEMIRDKVLDLLVRVMTEKNISYTEAEQVGMKKMLNLSAKVNAGGAAALRNDILSAMKSFLKDNELPKLISRTTAQFFEQEIINLAQTLSETLEKGKSMVSVDEDTGPAVMLPTLRAGRGLRE
ncbi:MAG: hypothetical protein ACI9S8_001181 [Chlamydiales bacterium]|jgi:hypothetical protein